MNAVPHLSSGMEAENKVYLESVRAEGPVDMTRLREVIHVILGLSVVISICTLYITLSLLFTFGSLSGVLYCILGCSVMLSVMHIVLSESEKYIRRRDKYIWDIAIKTKLAKK